MIDRIKLIMEFYNLSPAAFSEQIGINRSNLTHLFSGRNQPSLDLAKKILHSYPDIKTEWLIMGIGEMLRNDEDRKLCMNIQNEKREKQEVSEFDLFSTPPPKTITALELNVAKQTENATEIFNSRTVEKTTPTFVEKITENEPLPSHPTSSTVSKIVFFYSDSSFEVFYPK